MKNVVERAEMKGLLDAVGSFRLDPGGVRLGLAELGTFEYVVTF